MQKNAYLSIRLTPQERQRLDTWAAAGGRSAGGEVRYRLFSEVAETQMDTPAAASPDHRPAATPLTHVAGSSTPAKAVFDATKAGVADGSLPVGVTHGTTDIERQRAAQAERDAILRGVVSKR